MREAVEVIEKLRGKGLKVTPQRLAVVNALRNDKTHPSAEEVFAKVKKTCPTISFTTVYKTLEALSGMGDINILSCDVTRSRFDPDTSLHHHAICESCKEILDVQEQTIEPIDLDCKVCGGFKVHKIQVYVYGLCRHCQSARNS